MATRSSRFIQLARSAAGRDGLVLILVVLASFLALAVLVVVTHALRDFTNLLGAFLGDGAARADLVDLGHDLFRALVELREHLVLLLLIDLLLGHLRDDLLALL